MKGIFVKLDQGTSEWKEWRRSKIGASDVPCLMGFYDYTTPYQLFLEKINGDEKKETDAMRLGKETEEPVRRYYEEKFGIILSPCILQHPDYEWAIASLDGMDFDCTKAVEIKRNNKERHEIALDNMIPDIHFPQLQWAMFVSALGEMEYISHHKGENAHVICPRDEKYIQEMKPIVEKFWNNLQDFTPPLLCEKDFIQVNDPQFSNLASDYKKTVRQLKELEEIEKKLKDNLIQLSNDRNVIGSGLKLTKQVRRGNVDYEAIPQLKNINLDTYRKAPTQYWKISLV